jgi:hypothetical protein
MTRESGILETAQFVFMVIGLAIAVQLLFSHFVRRRPLVLAVTAAAALACLFIGGEEVSWASTSSSGKNRASSRRSTKRGNSAFTT